MKTVIIVQLAAMATLGTCESLNPDCTPLFATSNGGVADVATDGTTATEQLTEHGATVEATTITVDVSASMADAGTGGPGPASDSGVADADDASIDETTGDSSTGMLEDESDTATGGEISSIDETAGGKCGNDLLDYGEECDHGLGNDDQNACTESCKTNTCGDGLIFQGVEACDDGTHNANTAKCKVDCTAQECGDGHVGPGEQCDSGLNMNMNECDEFCNYTCGNGMVDDGEECDDGNMNPSDECTHECLVWECGDGIVFSEYEDCEPSLPLPLGAQKCLGCTVVCDPENYYSCGEKPTDCCPF